MRLLAASLAPLLLAACARAERISVEPASLRFVGRGKSTEVHATPYEKNGRPIPDPPCSWASSDERVATVVGSANAATVTAAGPGSAVVRCAIGGVVAELPVQVRVVARISVSPERADLQVTDVPAPLALSVEAEDDRGAPVPGRMAAVTCASEAVCRGDARGQIWPVGPGETTARVELEGVAATVAVKVVERRSADARPRVVKGNPMEEVERAYQAKQAREAKEAARRR
jgi:hypothetical protein